jgi:hypothetical protein
LIRDRRNACAADQSLAVIDAVAAAHADMVGAIITRGSD